MTSKNNNVRSSFVIFSFVESKRTILKIKNCISFIDLNQTYVENKAAVFQRTFAAVFQRTFESKL